MTLTLTKKKLKKQIIKETQKVKPKATNYKTKRLYLKKVEKENDNKTIIDIPKQSAGGIINKFKLWRILKKILSIFDKIKKGTNKLEKVVNQYKVDDKILKTLLDDRSNNIDALMFRYQELIFFEKQKDYLIAMQRLEPIKGDNIDYYKPQIEAIDNEYKKVDNFMKEIENRKKANDKEIADKRTKIEGARNKKINPKILKKFDSSMDEYTKYAEQFQEIHNQLQNFEKFKDVENKSFIDPKELKKAKLYYAAFSKYKNKREELQIIYNNADKIRGEFYEYAKLITQSQADYNNINEQYEIQKKNYTEIKPTLQKIFGELIPTIMNRKIIGLDDASNKMDQLINNFTLEGTHFENQIVPRLEEFNKTIKHTKEIQGAIIYDLGKITDDLFKTLPQGYDLNKKMDILIKGTNDINPYLLALIGQLEFDLNEAQKIQVGGNLQFGGTTGMPDMTHEALAVASAALLKPDGSAPPPPPPPPSTNYQEELEKMISQKLKYINDFYEEYDNLLKTFEKFKKKFDKLKNKTQLNYIKEKLEELCEEIEENKKEINHRQNGIINKYKFMFDESITEISEFLKNLPSTVKKEYYEENLNELKNHLEQENSMFTKKINFHKQEHDNMIVEINNYIQHLYTNNDTTKKSKKTKTKKLEKSKKAEAKKLEKSKDDMGCNIDLIPEWKEIFNIIDELTQKINIYIDPNYNPQNTCETKSKNLQKYLSAFSRTFQGISIGGNKTKNNKTQKYKLQNNILKKNYKKSKLKLLQKHKGGLILINEIIGMIEKFSLEMELTNIQLKTKYGSHPAFLEMNEGIITYIIEKILELQKKINDNKVKISGDDIKISENNNIISKLESLKSKFINIIQSNKIVQNINLNLIQPNQRMVGIIIMDDFSKLLISLINQNMGQQQFGQQQFGQQPGLQGFLQQQFQQQGTSSNSTQLLVSSIYEKIRQLLTNFLPSIITSLKTTRKQILEQVSEFSKLTKAFKTMDEKQKEIKKIESKINFKKLESSKVYVQIEEIAIKPKKSLEEIINDPISKKMLDIAKSKTPLLDKNIWKSFVSDIVANQDSFGLSSSSSQSFGTTQQVQQGQQPNMFTLASQQGQQGPQIKGLIQPDFIGVLGFPKLPTQNLMQQINNSIPFDLKEPTHINENINYSYNYMYDKLKQNPGMSLKEFVELMSTLPNKAKPDDIFLKHPYGLFILTIPQGINWLLNDENGNKLISKVIIIGNFRSILEERMTRPQVDSIMINLSTKANEIAIRIVQEQTQQKLLLAQGLGQQGQVQGLQQMFRQVPT